MLVTGAESPERVVGWWESEYAKPPNRNMDKEAFLELLLAELKHQDPMEPVNNKELVAQIASLNAVDQMVRFNENIVLIQAMAMLGRTVSYTIDGEDERSGVVVGVSVRNGKTTLSMDNGDSISIDRVMGIFA